MNETGVMYHPVFTKFAPLHTRRRLECTLGNEQTSFVMEVCECEANRQEDSEAVTLAKVVSGEFFFIGNYVTFHVNQAFQRKTLVIKMMNVDGRVGINISV